jgi:ribonuclease D
MSDIRAERVLGFDTETRPAFRKGEHHLPSLVQAATARAVYVFPLRQMDCSAAIAEFLGARHIVKIGVSVAHDLRELKLVFPLEAASVLDAGTVVQRFGLEQTGLRNLAALFLGFRIPKGTRTSNWAARRLSPSQLTYAATDAWVCRELFLRFRELGLLH